MPGLRAPRSSLSPLLPRTTSSSDTVAFASAKAAASRSAADQPAVIEKRKPGLSCIGLADATAWPACAFSPKGQRWSGCQDESGGGVGGRTPSWRKRLSASMMPHRSTSLPSATRKMAIVVQVARLLVGG